MLIRNIVVKCEKYVFTQILTANKNYLKVALYINILIGLFVM